MKTEWPKKQIMWTEGRTLYVSIPFTWNISETREYLRQRSFYWDKAIIGGPAVHLKPKAFEDMDHVTIGDHFDGVLQRINPLATRTTVGCIRRCRFCGVKQIEGKFSELDDWPDLPVICDNNLLACSQNHFARVIDRLVKHRWADFNQGIDFRLLKKYHADRLAEIKKPIIRLSLDSIDYIDDWEKAYRKLRKAGLPKNSIRSYVLIGFDTGPEEAWERCEWINGHGIKVLPMWFHPLDAMKKNSVTPSQKSLGWDDRERKIIMQYYYQRGKKRALILRDYGSRIKHKYVA